MLRNRLSEASSPYLRQHKDNPVHWQPWDADAFELAGSGDKPIFLSVGYSSCHWCHVMEHDVFENEEVAALLNEHFISIKVDREERPDVDDAYMTAVQLYNGHGGWPMTLFLTPDRKPFFAGTYLPAEDKGEHPGFKTVAAYFANGWKNHRGELVAAADEFGGALEHALANEAPQSQGALDWGLVDSAVSQFKSRFDKENGGFGGRPKFPPHQTLQLLLHLASKGREDCLAMARVTLDKMMLGGIHDQVGGGFHRYSTDEKWLLPHFEKMLYDNGQMLRNYAVALRLTGDEDYRRVCKRLVGWLEREMISPDGLFYSALDADSEGEEGLFYTWPYEEAASAGKAFLDAFGFLPEGNFNDEATGKSSGRNIPHLTSPAPGLDGQLDALLAARSKRVGPGLDDKCLTAWNGLMISGLAAFGRRDLAERAARALLAFDPVPHQVVHGKPEGAAFLDVCYFIEGLLDLGWTEEAGRLFDKVADDFRDPDGGWFFTSSKHERLFGRTKPVFDNASPSPVAVMTRCALRLGHMNMVSQDLEAALGWMERAPFASGSLLLVLAEALEAGLAKASPSTARVLVFVEPSSAAVVEGKARWDVRVTVPSGWHLQPITVGGESVEIEIAGLTEPLVGVPPGDFVGLQIVGSPPEGKEGEAKVRLRYQVCSEKECLPVEEKELSLVWYRG